MSVGTRPLARPGLIFARGRAYYGDARNVFCRVCTKSIGEDHLTLFHDDGECKCSFHAECLITSKVPLTLQCRCPGCGGDLTGKTAQPLCPLPSVPAIDNTLHVELQRYWEARDAQRVQIGTQAFHSTPGFREQNEYRSLCSRTLQQYNYRCDQVDASLRALQDQWGQFFSSLLEHEQTLLCRRRFLNKSTMEVGKIHAVSDYQTQENSLTWALSRGLVTPLYFDQSMTEASKNLRAVSDRIQTNYAVSEIDTRQRYQRACEELHAQREQVRDLILTGYVEALRGCKIWYHRQLDQARAALETQRLKDNNGYRWEVNPPDLRRSLNLGT